MRLRLSAAFVALVLWFATLAFPSSAARAELDLWVKAYEQSIGYAFNRDWLTRSVYKQQMIRASVDSIAVRSGVSAPVLTGDVNRDVALALRFLGAVFAAKPPNEWDDIFREALEGLVQRWDPYALALSPLDAAILMYQLGLYDEGDGVFVQKDEKTGKYFVSELIPGMGGAKAGLKVGDEVVALDGVLLTNLDEETIWRLERNARRRGFMIFRIKRGEDVIELQVEYRRRAIPKVKHRLIEDSIGWIGIESFEIYTGYEVEDALSELIAKGATSIILDLRNNPGGQPWGTQVTLSFFMRGQLYGRRSREGDIVKIDMVKSLPVENVFSGPVAVLVNTISASASEVTAFVMKRRPKARLFGQDISFTTGKGVGQLGKELANGWFFYFTVDEIVDLDGKTYHGQGVAVDETVLTYGIAGDPVLERAIAWLKSQK